MEQCNAFYDDIATLAFMFGWLVLLSVRSYQLALSEELVRSLMRGQEVCLDM